MTTIKILTLNTHKGLDRSKNRLILEDLRKALRDTNADLVFLQEVIGRHSGFQQQFSGWPSISHSDFLANEFWDTAIYGRNADYTEGHHGNAILSRLPVENWRNIDISIEGIEKRGLLYCKIMSGETPVHCICVHLSLKEPHRQAELRKICELIRSLPAEEPLILAGDFNDWRRKASKVLYQHCNVIEAFKEQIGRYAITFPASFPVLKLDRIYLRRGSDYTIHKFPRIPWASLSDHRPLMLQLNLS